MITIIRIICSAVNDLYTSHECLCVFTEDVDWNAQAAETLDEFLNNKPNENLAKNVIMFLGDGMGISTITAARIYKGQKDGNPGEETEFIFEKFPNAALSKVFESHIQWHIFVFVLVNNHLVISNINKAGNYQSSFHIHVFKPYSSVQAKSKRVGFTWTRATTVGHLYPVDCEFGVRVKPRWHDGPALTRPLGGMA